MMYQIGIGKSLFSKTLTFTELSIVSPKADFVILRKYFLLSELMMHAVLPESWKISTFVNDIG